MKGIQYVTNDKGKRTAVQIDLERHAKLWEDFEDVLLIKERLKERPRVGLEEVKRRYATKSKK
jgi:hypothetical protein